MTKEQCVNEEEPKGKVRSLSFFSHSGSEPSLSSPEEEADNDKDTGSGEADEETGEDDVTDAVDLKVELSAERVQWSEGANRHFGSECRPCAWNWRPSGCENGSACNFCHLCPDGALREKRKQTERRRKEERQALRAERVMTNWEKSPSLQSGLHTIVWPSSIPWQPSGVPAWNQETGYAVDITGGWPVQAQQQLFGGEGHMNWHHSKSWQAEALVDVAQFSY